MRECRECGMPTPVIDLDDRGICVLCEWEEKR